VLGEIINSTLIIKEEKRKVTQQKEKTLNFRLTREVGWVGEISWEIHATLFFLYYLI
jgi:hypothetical protein